MVYLLIIVGAVDVDASYPDGLLASQSRVAARHYVSMLREYRVVHYHL